MEDNSFNRDAQTDHSNDASQGTKLAMLQPQGNPPAQAAGNPPAGLEAHQVTDLSSGAAATGNVITGAGTTTGASGAASGTGNIHVVGAGAGAGAPSVSNVPNGGLAVQGVHGTLTINPDGSYTYNANPTACGTDIFTYSIANSQGQRSTASLAISVLGDTATAGACSINRVTPGPDGVVNLPANVALSDIHVNGRDLVVQLPDGSFIVIVEGAVYVPQLVLGDVTIPATNLAAVLISNEVQTASGSEPGAIEPAAGSPQSSGGNFEVPVGDIGDPFGLGDLVPPTQLEFGQPTFEEIGFIEEDEEPSITIITPENPAPGAVNATATVNEAGLPTRSGEPAGSNSAANSEFTSGTIVFNPGDMPSVIAINGVAITAIGQTFVSPRGVLTITSIDLANNNIGFSYLLTDNTLGMNVADAFNMTVTDADGQVAPGTLTVNLIDDAPTARPDSDSIPAGQFGPATGNVITDAAAGDAEDSDTNAADMVGADNASLTSVSGGGGSDSTFSAGVLVVNGQYGVLTIDAAGNYSYTRNAGTPGGVNDVFTYTLTDGDGDTSNTTLTISIGDRQPALNDIVVQVDDDTLPGGLLGGPGDGPDAVNIAGALAAIGGDGPLTFSIQLTGAPAGFAFVSGGTGVVLLQQNGTTVRTITFDPATGSYNVTQNAPILHAPGGNENDATFVFTVTVTDQDGDSDTGTLTVIVNDDTPVVARTQNAPPTLLVDETDLATNASVDIAALFAAQFGADGPSATNYSVTVVNGTNSGLIDVATGSTILLFNNAGVVEGRAGSAAGPVAFTVSVNGSGVLTLDQIRALNHPNTANPDDAVSPTADSIQLGITIIDADGDPASLSINIGDRLIFEDDGPDAAVNASTTLDTLVLDETRPLGTETDGDSNPAGLATVTASFADNFATVIDYGADGPGTVGYSLFLNGANVNSGLFALDATDTTAGDGDGIGQGAQILLNQVGNTITGSAGGTDYFTIAIDPATGVVTFTQLANIWHANTGSDDDTSTLTAPANSVQVRQTVTDADGDSDVAAMDVSQGMFQIEDDGPDATVAISATLDMLVLDETRPVGTETDGDSNPAGLATVTAGFADNFGAVDYGSDGPGSTTYSLFLNGANIASGLFALDAADTTAGDGDGVGQGTQILLNQAGNTITGAAGGTTYFTIAIDPATGVVTFTQLANIWHGNTGSDDDTSSLTAAANSLLVRQTLTDADGDSDSASIDISQGIFQIEDDGPDATLAISATLDTLVLDETRPVGNETDGDSNPAGLGSVTAGFADNFGVVDYGSDGPGSTVYSLFLNGSNIASGLFALDPTDTTAGDGDGIGRGASIVLNQTGNTITGSAGGTNYFTIAIDPSTGVLTFTQLANIWHSNTGNDDDTSTLTAATNSIQVRQTITDADGDSDTAASDISQGVFQIEDDGPDATVNASAALDTIVLDESRPLGSDTTGGVSPNGVATATASFADNFSGPVDHGTDGPGAVSYALLLSANGIGSGLYALDTTDKSAVDGDGYGQGAQITLSQAGNVVTGSAGGTNYFTASINPSTGVVTFTQLNNIWHPTPGASYDEPATLMTAAAANLQVLQTITDADGDSDTASINVGQGVFSIQDDGPAAVNDLDVIVGGNGPATGNVLTGTEVPGDANLTDGSADNPGTDGGSITGVTSVNVPANVDTDAGPNFTIAGQYGTLTLNTNGTYSYLRSGGPGGVQDVFRYTLTDGDGDTVTATLTITIDDNFPTAGSVNVQLDDDALTGGNALGVNDDPDSVNASGNLPGSGGDGTLTFGVLLTGAPAGFSYVSGGAGIVLVQQGGETKLTVTVNANGTYSVLQNNPIDHLAGDNENNVQFVVTYTVTDQDLDVANGQINIDVDDDTPVVTLNGSATLDAITLDESRPVGTDTAGGVAPTGLASATANFADNFMAPVAYGADGPGTTVYSLLLSANGIGSGLFALDPADVSAVDGDGIGRGAEITLSQAGNIVTGSSGGTNYFTIEINPATGVVTFTQINPIWHPTPGTSYDEAATLTTTAATNLKVVQTVTDADGDVASLGLNIGQGVFLIQDDGPDATLATSATLDTLVLDETRPVGTETDGDSNPAGLATVTAGFADNFGAVYYGSDGPGSTVYSLVLSGANIASGLYAIQPADTTAGDGDGIGQGAQILLNQVGNTVTGSAGGTDYFTIAINPSTGVVTFTQLANIWHSNTGNDDDTSTLAALANSLLVRQTVTDADGDTDSASIDVSTGVFQIEDDGPDAVINGSAALDTLVLDETRPLGTETDGDSNPAGLGAVTANFADNFIAPADHGSDGPGAVSYSLFLNGSNVNSGLFALQPTDDSASDGDGYGQGTQIVLNQSGNTITGSANGADYFTIAINPSTGVVTFTQLVNVWHANTANDDDTSTLTALANSLLVRQTVTDADGDSDTASIDVSAGVFQIEDDGPDAVGDQVSIPETITNFNVAFVIDFSNSINNTDLDIQLDAIRAAGQEIFGNTEGTVTITLVGFSSTASGFGTFSNVTDFTNAVNALNPAEGGTRPFQQNTDYTAAIQQTMASYVPNPNAESIVFFLSDGQPNEQLGPGGTSLLAGTATAWNTFVDNNNIDVRAIGITGDVVLARLQDVDVDGNVDVVLVAQFSDLIDALLESVGPPPTTGNILTNDDFGTDGGRILSITINGVTYTWDGANTITPSSGPAIPAGTQLTDIPTEMGGKLSFNFANGDWSFTPPGSVPATDTDIFTYTIIDNDGDSDSANLEITVVNEPKPTTTPVAITVDDEGLTGGNPGGTGDFVGIPNEAVVSGSLGINFGADGQGSVNFALMNNLTASIGSETVRYAWNAGTGTLTATIEGGARNGTALFTVQVTASGNYTVTLLDNVLAAGANENDVGPIVLTYTALDGDGTPANGTLSVTFDDDLPVNFTPVDLVDSTNATPITQDNALVNDGLANVTRLLNDANNDGIGENFIGADGFGGLAFTGFTNGSILQSDAAVNLTSGGVAIRLYGSGTGVLTASTAATAGAVTTGNTVFTITLIPGAGHGSASTYTIDFNLPVDDGSGFVFSNFSSAPAGQNDWIGVDSNGGDINLDNNDSMDLLVTPIGASVNTSATDIGTGNQWISANEGTRLDFVQDVRRDGANDEDDAAGYTFDSHYAVTDGQFKVMQTQGGGVATVRIRAFNDIDDTTPAADIKILTDGATVSIDAASVRVNGVAPPAANVVTIGTDVVIIGLNAGDLVTFDTVGNAAFNAFQVTNPAGTANPNGGTFASADFALGAFGFGSATTGNPIDLTFNVTATDADGDATGTGTIDIKLVPAPPVALDLDGDGLEFQSLAQSVAFDYDGDGTAEATAWVGTDDGLLARDANGDGKVTDGREIVFAVNGSTDLEGLRQVHDSNGDGKLTAEDTAWSQFGVWQDANGNGVSDAGEFKSLTELGITSIDLASDGKGYEAAGGDVKVHGEASYTRADGTTAKVGDVSFTTVQTVEQKLAQQAANNNAATAAAMAVGLAATAVPVAAAEPTGSAEAAPVMAGSASTEALPAKTKVDSGDDSASDLLGDSTDSAPSAQAASSSSHGYDAAASSHLSDASAPDGPAAPLGLLVESSLPLPQANAAAQQAAPVDMAGALVAAAGNATGPKAGSAISDAQVAQVLADALSGGSQGNTPSIDQLLGSLPGGEGQSHGLQPLAEALAAGTAEPHIPQEILHMLTEMATTGHDAAIATTHG